MFGRTKSPEAGKNIPLWKKAAALGTTALVLIGCGNKVDATDGPTPTPSPAIIETTPNTTPDVTLAPTTTIESPVTSSEAPTSSSETEAPAAELYTKNPDGTITFSYEAYKDNPEQLVQDFVEVGFNSWVDAGSDMEVLGGKGMTIDEKGSFHGEPGTVLEYNIGKKKYDRAAELSASLTPKFEAALFSDPTLALNSEAVTKLAEANNYQLYGFVYSKVNEDEKIEGRNDIYDLRYVVADPEKDIDILENTDGSHIRADVRYQLTDNFDTSILSRGTTVEPIAGSGGSRISLSVVTDASGNKVFKLADIRNITQ